MTTALWSSSCSRFHIRAKGHLLHAIRGSGAFRRFREMIHKLGLQESWFQFRQHALQQIAVNWLKENDIEYEWDTAEIIPPRKRDIEPAITVGEMAAILRAADSLIARGGRTLLVKILKGSKEKKVLELGLDKNPSAIRRR